MADNQIFRKLFRLLLNMFAGSLTDDQTSSKKRSDLRSSQDSSSQKTLYEKNWPSSKKNDQKKKSQNGSSVRGTSGRKVPSLQSLADRFEDELADRTFVYTLSEKGKKPVIAQVEYERSGFCHLFSVGSIVKEQIDDLDEFSGMKGWKNIKSGWITNEKLEQLNPDEFHYYAPEYTMMDELILTAKHPQAVRFVKSILPDSRLQADVLLYRIFGEKTVHIALSKGDDGWFVRSYFVRDNARDRQYPTKYIAGMPELEVKTAVKH